MRKSFSMLARLVAVGWRARCNESCTAGSGKGGRKRLHADNALAAYFTVGYNSMHQNWRNVADPLLKRQTTPGASMRRTSK
ncbi:MAG: hypothetical protein ACJ8BW_34245 [Ktedonobacteraceae bacterium]